MTQRKESNYGRQEENRVDMLQRRYSKSWYEKHTNGDYSDNTMDLIREEIVSAFPNLCNDVVFTENIHLYSYLTFDNRTDIEYNLNYLCQVGLM